MDSKRRPIANSYTYTSLRHATNESGRSLFRPPSIDLSRNDTVSAKQC